MNHDDALRLSAAERFLLGDLDEDLREQFEAHFFECAECATDVRAGAAMLDQMKVELAREPVRRLQVVAGREHRQPFFLRPVWLATAIAAMLLVIAYQNLVEVPHLRTEVAELNSPEVLSAVSLVNAGSRGGTPRSAEVQSGKPALLMVDIHPDDRFSSYEISVLDASGKPVWSMPVTAQQAKDTLPIEVPAADLRAGTNALVIRGVAAPGSNPIEIERHQFQIYSHN